LTKFIGGVDHGPGTNEFNFGDDSDHRPDPGVRSPKSGFTGLSIMQLAFGGGLRSLRTSSFYAIKTNLRLVNCTFKHLSEPGHGSISVVPKYHGKNWKLDTSKIICKWFDMKGYQSLLINYNVLHRLLNTNTLTTLMHCFMLHM